MITQDDYDEIIKNYQNLKDKLHTIEVFSDISISQPTYEELSDVFIYLEGWKGRELSKIKLYNLIGHLTFIHEYLEVNILKSQGNWPIKRKDIRNASIYNISCHYPAMIKEAEFLKMFSDRLEYNISLEEIACINLTKEKLKGDRDIMKVSHKRITSFRANESEIIEFFNKLSCIIDEDLIIEKSYSRYKRY
jgi:hypothetical protein